MINNLDLGKKVIKEKIPLLPKNPGVYRMLSSKKEILTLFDPFHFRKSQ